MKGFSVALLFGLVAFASAYPKDRCICTLEILPLCASNGVTYGNKCEFECDKQKEFNKDLTIRHAGQCETKDVCFCTQELLPICGSDGVTYSNQCSFQCVQKKNQDLRILHDGQCKEQNIEQIENFCGCTKEFFPLCGSDGLTYSNQCTFQCSQKINPDLRIVFEGLCEEKINENLAQPKDVCFCTLNFLPVCGSDGVTYANKCTFQCKQKKNQDLKVSHVGQCEEKKTENDVQRKEACICTKEFLPVCGSNGVTYSNQCSFKCSKKTSTNQDMHIAHVGPC